MMSCSSQKKKTTSYADLIYFLKLLERIIIIIITSRHLTFLFYSFLSRLIENPDGINSKLIWIFKQYTVGTLLTATFSD